MSPEGSDPISSKPKEKKPKSQMQTQANVTTTNNYYINNNYYSSSSPEGLEHILGDKKKTGENSNGQQKSDVKEGESNSKVTRIMNLAIIAAAIGLFLISLFMQNNKAPSNNISKEM